MKWGVIWISVFLVLSACEKSDIYPYSEEDPDRYRLIKISNFGNSADTEPSTFVDLEYDDHGNLIRESLYDFPNTLFTYKEYDYENNLLKEKRIYDGEVGSLRLGTYRIYTYDNSKLIKEELYLSNGTFRYSKHYEYDGSNLVNTYKFDDKLGIYHQYRYTYNSQDLVTLEERFMYDQQLDDYTKYQYDDRWRVSKTELFHPDHTIIQTREYIYTGSSTLPAEELYYDADGQLSQQWQFVYDDLWNLTETNKVTSNGIRPLSKKKYLGKLLIEQIQYAFNFGYSEWWVTRYEYEEIR